MTDISAHDGRGPEMPRRDFLLLVAGSLGAVGTASAIWPFIASLEPAADTIAAGAPIDVDLSPIKPGQQIIVLWRRHPTFIVRRTPEELAALQAKQDTGLLRDADSSAVQQPAYAKNWHRSVQPEFLVLVGICTHLGCVPQLEPAGATVMGGSGAPAGFLCPCHGSKYDLAGRVFASVPAPYNLPVPPYRFLANDKIRIGENPLGSKFDLSEIKQI